MPKIHVIEVDNGAQYSMEVDENPDVAELQMAAYNAVPFSEWKDGTWRKRDRTDAYGYNTIRWPQQMEAELQE